MKDDADEVRVITSTLPGTAATVPFATVLRSAISSVAKGVPVSAVFETTSTKKLSKVRSFRLWATEIPEVSNLSIEEGQERCTAFLSSKHRAGRCCTLLLQLDDAEYDAVPGVRSVLLVLSQAEDGGIYGVVSSHEARERQIGDEPDEKSSSYIATRVESILSWARTRLQWHSYQNLPGAVESKGSSWRRIVVIASLLAIIAIGLVSTIFYFTHNEEVYDRYDTSGSIGPKHQLRIYWQNASEWAAENPIDTTKWRVRIDDQAIIPASLYDEDEDRYQEWYRKRYPEMQEVIDNGDYIRPAWMGSLNMRVPWDDQFHFAHCVLALRRYWKAKESGHHVCGRDIDYLHMEHCLESLEERVFIEGPRDTYDYPMNMYWQTRVCF
jgi:hypothetical protein